MGKVDRLIKSLNNRDKWKRSKAAKALETLADPKALEPLIAALQDDYEFVRGHACRALGNIKDQRAVDPLIEYLKDHEVANYDAMDALGAIDPKWGNSESAKNAVPIFTSRLENWKLGVYVHSHSARLLGEIKDNRAVEPLIQVLKNKSSAATAVAWALGEIGDKRAVEPLQHALKEGDYLIRNAVKQALEKLGVKEEPQDLKLTKTEGDGELIKPKETKGKLRCQVCGNVQHQGDWKRAADAKLSMPANWSVAYVGSPQCLKCGSRELTDASRPGVKQEEEPKIISEAAEEILLIMDRYFQSGGRNTSFDDSKGGEERIKTIGKELFESGGHETMVAAFKKARSLAHRRFGYTGSASLLEWMWDGIGNWLG